LHGGSWSNALHVQSDHAFVPILAVIAYIGLMIVGQRYYFANRKPWDWRQTMALWNLSLSTFSAIGFLRTAPQLLHNLTNYTWRQNFCFDPESHYGSGSTGLWVQLFILSKFPELFDTFFIVIHKKPVIFLHWYHHVSVLLYCWHSYVTKAPTGIVFCVMNYAVHAIMYFYYFLMAVHMKPKAFQAVYITAAQISQMVVGVIITTIGCYLLWVEGPPDNCWLTPDNNVAALVMYGSYLFLFLEFFWQRYNKKSKKSSAGGSAIKKPVKKE
jgi:elongation of very long chain fatty acids protein 6